jgi:single-stranded DNA-specific DHH superfamily exonuclease
LHEINQGLIYALDWLEPFGMGNPEPVFEIYGLTPGNFQRMGSEQEHGKFTYYLNASQSPMHEMSKVEVIGWGKGEEMARLAADKQGFALRGEVDLNLFRGELRINIIVQEFSPGEGFPESG